jgi:hypothetical protein
MSAAAVAASCGRQVTPNREGSNVSNLNSGFMSCKFDVNGPFNFQSYNYAMVFNTSGTTITPVALGSNNAYAGYSFAIIVGNTSGGVQANAYQFVRPNNNQNTAPIVVQLVTTPGQLQLYTNTNGQGTEFTVIFQRSIVNGITTPSPSPGTTASASPSSSPIPTASPSPSPSPSGSPSGSPSPSPTPIGGSATTWYFNYFVTQTIASGQPLIILDSLGAQGGQDATYTDSTPLYTDQVFNGPPFYTLAGNHPSDPAAQIASGTIANNP